MGTSQENRRPPERSEAHSVQGKDFILGKGGRLKSFSLDKIPYTTGISLSHLTLVAIPKWSLFYTTIEFTVGVRKTILPQLQTEIVKNKLAFAPFPLMS